MKQEIENSDFVNKVKHSELIRPLYADRNLQGEDTKDYWNSFEKLVLSWNLNIVDYDYVSGAPHPGFLFEMLINSSFTKSCC